MAKKWQDVEFVDYKERQKRRRMRKRVNAQDELAQSVQSRWNIALVGSIIGLFVVVIGVSGYFMLQEQGVQEEKSSKMYIESRVVEGDVQFRKFEGDEYLPIIASKKYYNSGEFRTGDGSRLELITFDDVIFKLRALSELILENIEVFGENQRTKTTVSLEDGEYVFDSRKSRGLLEIKTDSLTVYAARALFKVVKADDKLQVKLSQGMAKVEMYDDLRELNSSQMVEVRDASLSGVESFNPLGEAW